MPTQHRAHYKYIAKMSGHDRYIFICDLVCDVKPHSDLVFVGGYASDAFGFE